MTSPAGNYTSAVRFQKNSSELSRAIRYHVEDSSFYEMGMRLRNRTISSREYRRGMRSKLNRAATTTLIFSTLASAEQISLDGRNPAFLECKVAVHKMRKIGIMI